MPAKDIRIAVWYNQAINIFWATLGLAPVGYFSYRFLPAPWLCCFLTISFAAACLPKSFFDRIQLGTTTVIYHKLGIRTVRKYTQDGSLINGIIRRRFPAYNPIRNSTTEAHLSRARVNERFHFSAFAFLLSTSLYALSQGNWWWAVVMTLGNLLFNIYPILLQQYNRIRFKRLFSRPIGSIAVEGVKSRDGSSLG